MDRYPIGFEIAQDLHQLTALQRIGDLIREHARLCPNPSIAVLMATSLRLQLIRGLTETAIFLSGPKAPFEKTRARRRGDDLVVREFGRSLRNTM